MTVVQKVLSYIEKEEPEVNIFLWQTHITYTYKTRKTNSEFTTL